MCWNRHLAFLRSLRFRMAAAFTAVALLAALITTAVMAALQYAVLVRGFDAELRKHWESVAKTPGRALAEAPPRPFLARLAPGGRSFLEAAPSVRGREQVFLKPYYGRRGQRPDRWGFWTQTVETRTGGRLTRYRVCARPLPDGTLLAAAQGLGPIDEAYLRILAVGVLGFALMAALLVAFGMLVARRLLRGFSPAVAAVDAMAAGDFSHRMEAPGMGEELECLARSVNALAENTESLLADLWAVTDNIAHDLRTPITRLRARAELAFRSGDAKGLAGEVAEECDTMLDLIGALLEIARVGHGVGVGHGTPTDGAALLRDLADLFSADAEERGITLACHLPEATPARLLNAPLLRRALSNLLGNALKFTPAGGSVTLSFRDDGDTLRFGVADTGCGIAPEDQERIFERFYRADASRSRPGFGLGLALVRAVAKALGGKVVLESAPGRGSVFAIVLPAVGADRDVLE